MSILEYEGIDPRVHQMRIELEGLREALRAESMDKKHRKELLEDPAIKTIYFEMEDKFKGTPTWEKLEDRLANLLIEMLSILDTASWRRCDIG